MLELKFQNRLKAEFISKSKPKKLCDEDSFVFYNTCSISFVACSPHFYGELCKNPCGSCSSGVTCNNVDGTCPNRCDKCITSMCLINHRNIVYQKTIVAEC